MRRIAVHVHVVLFLRHQVRVHKVSLSGEALEGPHGDARPGYGRLERGPARDGLADLQVLLAGQAGGHHHHHLVRPRDPIELLPEGQSQRSLPY